MGHYQNTQRYNINYHTYVLLSDIRVRGGSHLNQFGFGPGRPVEQRGAKSDLKKIFDSYVTKSRRSESSMREGRVGRSWRVRGFGSTPGAEGAVRPRVVRRCPSGVL